MSKTTDLIKKKLKRYKAKKASEKEKRNFLKSLLIPPSRNTNNRDESKDLSEDLTRVMGIHSTMNTRVEIVMKLKDILENLAEVKSLKKTLMIV